MRKLFRILYWLISVLVVLVLVGLGLRLARALLGVALLVGIGVIAYGVLGRPRQGKG